MGSSDTSSSDFFCRRHVFLCYKNPAVWPPRIEAAEFDRLPRLLHAAINARKPHIKKETCLTICEGHDGTETSNGDVLIFPDMIRYRRLTHFDVETFVEEVLVKEGNWLPGNPESLKASYVFVCSHGSRDRRYGYVTPDDVPLLFRQHIIQGEIFDSLWRGQIGLSEDEQKKKQEQRLQLNGGRNLGGMGAGCCQTDGESCCQDNEDSCCCQNDVLEEMTELSADNKRRENVNVISRINKGKGASLKFSSMPTWLDSWEQEDTYAAFAVVCAAVSVAIAYSCYKQMR
ncbi:hypothetical protein HKD37_18G049901 [Glycine soja]